MSSAGAPVATVRTNRTRRYSVSRVVVTGGARGLGAAIAERLAQEGFDVALIDVNEGVARETASRIAGATGAKVAAFGCDVTDREALEVTFAEAARLLGGDRHPRGQCRYHP